MVFRADLETASGGLYLAEFLPTLSRETLKITLKIKTKSFENQQNM